jgi:multidrug resistance protein
MSPVSSSILAPSLEDIGHELNIKSASVQSLCLSIFVLGFASGPLIFAPLSEMYGRRIVLHASHVLYLIFNCACGFAQTTAQMLAFRFLGGVGGSAALALGPGVLADLFSADQRGVSSGLYALFPMLGPALGPLCGGFITEYTTWRWGFWGTSIVDVPILTLGLVFLEETYPTVLIRWRKDKLVKQTGNTALFTPAERIQLPLTKQLGQALLRPMKLLTTQVIIIVMGAYQAYLYGLMYLVLTTFPRLWTQDYGQSPSHAGLNYISLGLGYCIGLQVCSQLHHPTFEHALIGMNRPHHTSKTKSTESSRNATTASASPNFASLS